MQLLLYQLLYLFQETVPYRVVTGNIFFSQTFRLLPMLLRLIECACFIPLYSSSLSRLTYPLFSLSLYYPPQPTPQPPLWELGGPIWSSYQRLPGPWMIYEHPGCSLLTPIVLREEIANDVTKIKLLTHRKMRVLCTIKVHQD